MRVKKIKISWFRGSSDPVEMDLNLKSLALYGENGSGKSSFVDAIEYIISDGKINHLAHEYSGRRQEKAILNTHTPENKSGEITITLEDNSIVEIKISKNGTFVASPESSEINSWDYRCTILRQNEVANFIADTKGDKYSALLPLLGLSHLEITAENLRKIERSLLTVGEINIKNSEIARIEVKRKSVFGNANRTEIEKELKDLYLKYCKKAPTTETFLELLNNSLVALTSRIDQLTFEQKVYSSLLEISKLDISLNLSDIKESARKLGESAQPLILEKLTILKAASDFSQKNKEEEIKCPACGKPVSSAVFSEHVKAEELALKEIVKSFDIHRNNINLLCNNLENFKRSISQDHLKDWREKQNKETILYITSINIDGIRKSCSTEIQADISSKILPIIELTKTEVANPLPEVKELVLDKEKLETIKELLKGASLKRKVEKIESLINFIATLQKKYREEIRTQSSSIIGAISADIASMWEVLHPDEKVENVRLCLPSDVDKAVEVGLKFYGVEQDSPRLTLSEGHRNSLGLCIFLAMAKKYNSNPIFLDDVVVSFDRNHRGMVGTLLEKEFSDRQIILFTHERDWYIELKTQLDKKKWEFKTLMPWERPDIGIRFSTKQFTFDDARAFLPTNPDSAGNTARKIMDISAAVLAESLEINLPYLHRERNDHRTGHEFLEKISSSLNSFLIKRNGVDYEPFTEALKDVADADKLIISWGNKASHDFDIVKNEATLLINTCEKALSRFSCLGCNKHVTYLNNEKSGFKQCECGSIRWKY